MDRWPEPVQYLATMAVLCSVLVLILLGCFWTFDAAGWNYRYDYSCPPAATCHWHQVGKHSELVRTCPTPLVLDRYVADKQEHYVCREP